MIAKKRPQSDARHAEQTRKVDSMSELVAGMLLEDPDATMPPPEQSPGSLSAVRSTPRPLDRPPTHGAFAPRAHQEPAPRSRVIGSIVIALVIALAGVSATAAYLFTR
jgi:hypothetical protein